ncbi:trypsin-like serine protease with C-terminal PDZ domain [Clostridium sp. CAG:440]|jgi:serine protease Do|nr:trypsin-like serine protease with C-terminal PDZ domain [Clostridium sp. CAG:440]
MEEKNNENKNSNFKAVQNPENYKTTSNLKNKSGFGKTVVLPFISGVLGCAAVVGVCFGIPDVKYKLIGTNSSNFSVAPSNSTSSDGTVSQVKLSNYSDTAVYTANKILPSIVGIKVEYTVSSNFSIYGMGTAKSEASASGSGIIISDDGYILTNNHIVATSSSESYYQVSDANKVTVTLYNDDTEYEAKIVGKDEQTDLAVIKIEKTGLSKAEFADSDSIKVGEFAMAVGNPLGMQSSITCGVVSAVNREVTDSDGKKFTLIQTDAAINSGNSGGALVNGEGKVIGINTLKLSGTGIEGMGFAIPINSTTDITSQLIQYSKVKRPYIGISGVDLDEKTAKVYNLVVGVYVKSIEDFSAAEKAGVKVGDVIVEADGKKITSMNELNEIKNSHKIGDELKIKVNRNNKTEELTLTLGEQP